jgi:RNA polymerase sigma-70 factor (ECF subfamily)
MSASPDDASAVSISETDRARLEEWLSVHREQLRAMVALRVDHRLGGRIDPSDVVQEAFLEAAQRYPEYCRNPNLSPYVWLRFLTMQRLLILHRRHAQSQNRDAAREVRLDDVLDVSVDGLARYFADSGTSPSGRAARADEVARLQQALGTLEPIDREILALRHFEQLTNREAADVLGIRPGTASQRYFRAVDRLREILTPDEGGSK